MLVSAERGAGGAHHSRAAGKSRGKPVAQALAGQA